METVIIKIGDVFHKHHFSNAGDCSVLTIGRAFSNDVILADPYVGPSQLALHVSTDAEHDGDWQVSNVDGTNPIFVNKKIVETPEFNLRSGDEITLGRTNITIYSEDHAIPKTREFSFTNWLHNHKFKPLIATVMLTLLFAISLWMSYLEMSSELDWAGLTVAAMIIVIVTVIWASGWALTGRLVKGNHYFFSHLFFTSLCFILLLIAGEFHSYVDYIFSSILAGVVVDWLIAILLCGLMIGFNLALMTHSPGVFSKGMVASACFLGVMAALVYLYQDEYSNQPEHSVTVKPAYIPTTAALSIEQYVQNYNELFDSLSAID